MRSRRAGQDHDAAVSRRLELLRAELAVARGDEQPLPVAVGDEWWHGHTRVAGGRAPLAVVPVDAPPAASPAVVPDPPLDLPLAPGVLEAPAVPVPGRHAARRRAAGAVTLTRLVPSSLRGRVDLGVAQLAVLAVLVSLGLGATTWWVLRSQPEVVPASGVVPAPATGDLVALPGAGTPAVVPGRAPAAAAGEPAVTPGTVTVDVAGRVRRPGIAVLPAGARVVDALEAAGGARPGVDLSSLNLARLLVDGEQVLVGRVAGAVAGVPGVPATPVPGAGGAVVLVNLNVAGLGELETLPEVGPVTAQAIVAWREEHGGFTSVQELLEVDGIGDATLEQIAPHVTV